MPSRLMSIRWAGAASRSFMTGIRLCPPASTFASSPCSASSWRASSSESGRWYSNLDGSMENLLARSRWRATSYAATTGTTTIPPRSSNGQVNLRGSGYRPAVSGLEPRFLEGGTPAHRRRDRAGRARPGVPARRADGRGRLRAGQPPAGGRGGGAPGHGRLARGRGPRDDGRRGPGRRPAADRPGPELERSRGGQRARDRLGVDGFGPGRDRGVLLDPAWPPVPEAPSGPSAAPGPTAPPTRRSLAPPGTWPEP